MAVIRKLGHMENYHQAWHTLHHLISNVIACRYALPASVASQPEDYARALFEHAVAGVVMTHPMLRVAIADAAAKKPSWLCLDSLDLVQHMDWQTLDCASEQDYEEKLQTIIDHNLDTVFPYLNARPGWRMTLLRRRIVAAKDDGDTGKAGLLEPFVECVFAWNHSHFDGMSAKLFHENLLANLNTSLSSSSPLSANTVSQLPLKDHVLDLSAHPLTKENFVPNLHDITKIPITPGFMVKTAWKELKPPRKQQADHPASTETTTSSSSSSPRAPSPGCASWAPIVADSYKTHNLRSNPLDGPALDRVLALCRAGHEGGSVTLTALINALCLSSLAPLLPASGSFEAGTAINFRRFLRSAPPGYPSFEPGRTMANYVTVMGHRFGPQIVSEVRETDTSTTTKPTTTTKTTTSTAADDSAGAHASHAATTTTTSDAAKRTTWKAAAESKHALDARMRRGTKNDVTGLMALIGDWRAQHTANTRKPRHAAWNLSNLGVIDGGNSGTDGAESWAVTRSWFCMGAMVCGGAFMISPVAVKGHGLFIGCSWQDGVVDRELAESFFARLDGRLREMAAQA